MPISRRNAIKALALTPVIPLSESMNERYGRAENSLTGGLSINHSACRWCYDSIPLDELCRSGKAIGLKAIDLLTPAEWATATRFGLEVSMGFSQPEGYGITKGFNRIENHAVLVPFYEDLLRNAANAGVRKIICFSGNREGLSDEMGLAHCTQGLQKLLPLAERLGITLCMELLNSKVDHKDYQCDRTDWGVALAKSLDSESFKLLYDIYHMQIMEGNVIRTIRDNHMFIGHYHTGGVPGRNEIDESQELYYPAIMKAVADTGFKGFVAQEFIPKAADKLSSLKKCVAICS